MASWEEELESLYPPAPPPTGLDEEFAPLQGVDPFIAGLPPVVPEPPPEPVPEPEILAPVDELYPPPVADPAAPPPEAVAEPRPYEPGEPVPDAISGEEAAPPDYSVDAVSGAAPYEDPTSFNDKFNQYMDGLVEADPIQAGRVLAALPPEYAAAYDIYSKQKRAAEAQRQLDEKVAAAEGEIKKREAQRAEADAQATKLANEIEADSEALVTDIDTGRLINQSGGLGRLFLALASGVSAVNQLYHGGPNQTLVQFQQAVEQDIAAQKAEINAGIRKVEAKRGLLSHLHDRSGDLDRAVHTMRITAYKQAQQHVASEMAKYDPNNTIARGYAATLIGLRQGEAAAIAKAREAAAKRAEAALKAKLDIDKAMLEREKFEWQKQKDMGRLGGGGGGGGGGLGRGAPVARPDTATIMDVAAGIARSRGIKDWKMPAPGTLEEKRIQENAISVNGTVAIMQTTGTPGAEKTREALEEAMRLGNVLRPLIELVEAHGWEPAFGRYGTEAGKKMLSLYQTAVGIVKGPSFMNLGVLTGPDKGIIDGALGQDPTKAFAGPNAIGALKVQLNLIEQAINDRLQVRQALDANGNVVEYRAPPIPDRKLLQQPRVPDLIKKVEKYLDDGRAGEAADSAIELEYIINRGRGTTAEQREQLGQLAERLRNEVPEDIRRGDVSRSVEPAPGGYAEQALDVTAEGAGKLPPSYDVAEKLAGWAEKGTDVDRAHEHKKRQKSGNKVPTATEARQIQDAVQADEKLRQEARDKQEFGLPLTDEEYRALHGVPRPKASSVDDTKSRSKPRPKPVPDLSKIDLVEAARRRKRKGKK